MKFSILFIALFLAIRVAGQPVQEIKRLLKSKNFISFDNYINRPQKSNVDFGWELLRNVVGDYSEGIVKIEEHVPADDSAGGTRIKNYRIYLLATKDSIFYYKFIKTEYKRKEDDEWERHEATVDSVRNNTEYFSFKTLFKRTYGDTVNDNDLFLTSVEYGSHCGYAGINPEYMQHLDSLIQNESIDIIRQWLKSANAEKQLYAILGYRILVNQGYVLTEAEKS